MEHRDRQPELQPVEPALLAVIAVPPVAVAPR
jgi:hypothetical protein